MPSKTCDRSLGEIHVQELRASRSGGNRAETAKGWDYPEQIVHLYELKYAGRVRPRHTLGEGQ